MSAGPLNAPPASALRRPPTARERLRGLGRRLLPWDDGTAAGPGTGRAATIDLAGTAATTVIALIGFRTTFDGWGWLVPGILGLLCGLWNAHLVAVLRLPVVALAALLAVTYFLLGGPLAVRDDLIAGVIPTGATFAALGHEIVYGWKEALTSLAPLDSAGPHLALPFAFALIGSATGYAIARRFPPALAALPAPLGLLAASIAFGTAEPGGVLVQGVLFAWVALGWAAARSARRRSPLQTGAGRTTRAVTVAALLAVAGLGGALLGPRLPGSEATGERTVWRTALVPPFDVSQFPSPLAGFRKYTEPNPVKLWDRTLLTASGMPAGIPLRLAVMDTYDGFVFGVGNVAAAGGDEPLLTGVAPTEHTFHKVGSRIDVKADGDRHTVRIAIPDNGWSDVWVPTAGTVTGLRFDGDRKTARQDELRFNVGTNSAVLPSGLTGGDAWTMDLIVDPAQAGWSDGPLPEDVSLATGAVDGQRLTFLDARIDSWSGQQSDPWRKIRAIAAQMRSNGAYTDGGAPGNFQNVYLPGHSAARLTRFVKSEQLAGNDEQYAAALALAAQRLGVPSRVVLGAMPESDGTVKGKDVRAWVELKTASGRWQAISPAQFVPDRNKAPSQSQQRTDQRREGAQVPPPAVNNPPSMQQGPDQAQLATQLKPPPGKKSILDPSTWPDWLRWLATVVGLPLAVIVALWALLAGVKALRRRRRRQQGPPEQRIARGWAEVVDQARDLRLPVAPAATRLEQAAIMSAPDAIGGRLGRRALLEQADRAEAEQAAREAAVIKVPVPESVRAVLERARSRAAERADVSIDTLRPLAVQTNAAVFGPGQPTPEQVTATWEQVTAARKALRARRSWLGRVRADLSVRSFVASPWLRERLAARPRPAWPARAGRGSHGGRGWRPGAMIRSRRSSGTPAQG